VFQQNGEQVIGAASKVGNGLQSMQQPGKNTGGRKNPFN